MTDQVKHARPAVQYEIPGKQLVSLDVRRLGVAGVGLERAGTEDAAKGARTWSGDGGETGVAGRADSPGRVGPEARVESVGRDESVGRGVSSGSAESPERVGPVGHVAEVTLIGPGKGNLLGPDFWAELPRVFTALDRDETIRAVVLAGSGGTFSYGLDLMAFGRRWQGLFNGDPGLAGPRTRLHDEIRVMQDAVTAIAECRKPVVAAISGWCIGGGVDVIAACDVRYASSEARFSVREVRMAMVADLGSLQRLPAIIGDGHFRELALTGKDIDAAWAERIGLVNRVLPGPDEVLATAREFADEVAENPPLTVQGVKQVLDAKRASRVQIGLKQVAAWNAAFMSSEDLVEAVTAFSERRSPDFTGH